jgi:trk system potassium uptake protein TrkH
MIIFSINFNLFYFALIGNIKDAIKSEELRALLTIFLVSSILITISLAINNVYSIWDSLRYGTFQVSSIISTTGYSTADWSTWPSFCQAILFILMFIGGSAGSTAGGLKIYRVVIISKLGFNAIKKTFSPRSYLTARMDGKAVDENLIKSITGYFMTYVLACLCSFLLLSLVSGEMEGGVITNLSAVTTCFNNVGPGLGSLIGPVGNFASYNPLSKLVLILSMLLGRLEIFPMLILFTPLAWKKMSTDNVEQNA